MTTETLTDILTRKDETRRTVMDALYEARSCLQYHIDQGHKGYGFDQGAMFKINDAIVRMG